MHQIVLWFNFVTSFSHYGSYSFVVPCMCLSAVVRDSYAWSVHLTLALLQFQIYLPTQFFFCECPYYVKLRFSWDLQCSLCCTAPGFLTDDLKHFLILSFALYTVLLLQNQVVLGAMFAYCKDEEEKLFSVQITVILLLKLDLCYTKCCGWNDQQY